MSASFKHPIRPAAEFVRPPCRASGLASGAKTSQPFYHRNQQYSIVGLTNAAGTLVERYTYTAYGTLGIYAANGTVRTTSTYANRYTYTGREYDPDLKLYHFRARWYDPATGGFISRDPLGYVDGMSLYRGYFVPNIVDPFGEAIPLLPICAVVCVGSYLCISPCSSVCWDIAFKKFGRDKRPDEMTGDDLAEWAQCTLNCLSNMHWYGQLMCGGVSCGCIGCLGKYAKDFGNMKVPEPSAGARPGYVKNWKDLLDPLTGKPINP